MGAAKIASMYDMDVHEVKKLQAILKAAMPATTDWQRSTVKQVEKDGVLVNPFGRKRWFWTDRAATEGVAFLPQSTGADIIFRAMIGLLYERIGMAPETAQRISPVCRALPTGVSLLLTVHDSLLFECPPEKLSELLSCLHAVLEQPWPQLGGFILPISIGVGETWGSVESYKETV
jgi:DNA polymerase I-like protein with 3'-5' exonuclease and polymerase domains